MMVSNRFLILAFSFVCLIEASEDSVSKIDYETLSKNNNEFLKQNELFLVAVGESMDF